MYTSAAPRLSVAELAVLAETALDGRVGSIESGRPFGAEAVTFETELALSPSDVAVVSAMSAALALFEVVEGGLLRPVVVPSLEQWPDDLVTIQRYPGKTNEQFTRLMVNLALSVSRGSAPFNGTKLRVLDPLCGRGTTLNQAVLLGHDAVGIDMDKTDVDAYVTFFSTWLKDKRAKHRTKSVGKKTTYEFSVDKEAEQAGRSQQVVVAEADTTSLVAHIGKSTCDALVADLPYGVQHAGRNAGVTRRSPIDLLGSGLPVWRSALRPGAGLVMAFNRRTLRRDELTDLAVGAGFAVVEPLAGPDAFVHRVDQSIERDIVILRR